MVFKIKINTICEDQNQDQNWNVVTGGLKTQMLLDSISKTIIQSWVITIVSVNQ